ncbi:MAG: hypothetical protein E5X11_10220, partial [Mesorhizobium sp.]
RRDRKKVPLRRSAFPWTSSDIPSGARGQKINALAGNHHQMVIVVGLFGAPTMVDDGQHPTEDSLLQRLVREIGITELQARELIAMLGPSWNSLVREAKMLKRNRPHHN